MMILQKINHFSDITAEDRAAQVLWSLSCRNGKFHFANVLGEITKSAWRDLSGKMYRIMPKQFEWSGEYRELYHSDCSNCLSGKFQMKFAVHPLKEAFANWVVTNQIVEYSVPMFMEYLERNQAVMRKFVQAAILKQKLVDFFEKPGTAVAIADFPNQTLWFDVLEVAVEALEQEKTQAQLLQEEFENTNLTIQQEQIRFEAAKAQSDFEHARKMEELRQQEDVLAQQKRKADLQRDEALTQQKYLNVLKDMEHQNLLQEIEREKARKFAELEAQAKAEEEKRRQAEWEHTEALRQKEQLQALYELELRKENADKERKLAELQFRINEEEKKQKIADLQHQEAMEQQQHLADLKEMEQRLSTQAAEQAEALKSIEVRAEFARENERKLAEVQRHFDEAELSRQDAIAQQNYVNRLKEMETQKALKEIEGQKAVELAIIQKNLALERNQNEIAELKRKEEIAQQQHNAALHQLRLEQSAREAQKDFEKRLRDLEAAKIKAELEQNIQKRKFYEMQYWAMERLLNSPESLSQFETMQFTGDSFDNIDAPLKYFKPVVIAKFQSGDPQNCLSIHKSNLVKSQTRDPMFRGKLKPQAVRIGSEFRLEVASRQNGYLTILCYGTSGSILLLCPYCYDLERKVGSAAGKFIFPEAENLIEEGPEGQEIMVAIVSDMPLIAKTKIPTPEEGGMLRFTPAQYQEFIDILEQQKGHWMSKVLTYYVEAK